MEEMKVRFNAGAIENGVDGKKADEIFDLMAYFAGYGFNKSHSAAYGMIAYQTAWLKTHHRAEYMAALMTIDANNTDNAKKDKTSSKSHTESRKRYNWCYCWWCRRCSR